MESIPRSITASWQAIPGRVGSLVLALAVAATVLVSAASADSHRYPRHDPPVDAPVVDPFRPPSHVGGRGNRGFEYAAAPGTIVAASAAGQVSFAGQVGGTLHVTVTHPDGLRTSYSFLSEVRVGRGQLVAAGQPLGIAGRGFHFGVRDAHGYVDPASILAVVVGSARLVPLAANGPRWGSAVRSVRRLPIHSLGSQGIRLGPSPAGDRRSPAQPTPRETHGR